MKDKMKICYRCKQERTLKDFSKNKTNKGENYARFYIVFCCVGYCSLVP